MNEREQMVVALVTVLDEALTKEQAKISTALDALSLMAADLAVTTGLDRETYLEDVGRMYDFQYKNKQSQVQ
jgi:hypothetical protein